MKIKTSLKLAEVVSRFISREETRYYLNGICFTAHPSGGVLMVATDGHTLGAVHDPDGVIELGEKVRELIIPVSEDCKKKMKKMRDGVFYWRKNVTSLLPPHAMHQKPDVLANYNDWHDYMESAEAIDGTFPDWPRVVPKGACKPVSYFDFKADYLARFEGEMGGVRIYGNAPAEPHILKISSIPTFMGVLMPMQIRECGESPYPDWFKDLAPANQGEAVQKGAA